MPSYLWSVTNAEGRVIGQRVQAPSPEAARALLEAKGFTNLKLQQDDFGNALDAGRAIENPLEGEEFTADEELEFRRPHGFFGGVWRTLKSWAWALVPLTVWNAWNLYRGLRWSVSVVAGATLLLIVLYLMITLSAVSVCYNRLLHAVAAGRWTAVAGLVKMLRFLRWFNGFGVPRHEIVFRQAQVLFERSGLEAAVQHYSACSENAALPKMLYWSRLSQFYFAAQRFEEGLETQKRSFDSGKHSATELIDRGYHLVHFGLDPRGARELLAQVEGREITELARSYVDLVEGMISYREGRFPDAKNWLEAGLAKALAFRGTPLMAGHVRLIKTYLCLTCARLGETSRGKQLFREVAKFLKIQHEFRLLEECRINLGSF